MKTTITLTFLFVATFFYGQECKNMTAGSTFIHDNFQYNILNGKEAFNELNYKVGIGQDGDIDSREYAPIIYSSNIWAGGKDPNGNVKLAIGDYTSQDWVAGPLDEDGQTTAENCLNWDRVFTVSKEDIMKARKIFLEGGPCDEIPESVLNWPGRENPNLSFMPNYFRGADYYDEDLDAWYNPCAGDLPYVSIWNREYHCMDEYFSSLPSQISYYVMNDNGKVHQTPNSTPLQTQLEVYVFSYKMQEAEDIIFVKYKSRNYATDDISNFHFGNWFDFDLGCKENDFLGTDVERNMLYVYNNSADEECDEEGFPLPEAQFGVSYLGGMFSPYLIVNIDGKDSLVDPPIGTGMQDTLVRTKMATSIIPVECYDAMTPNACFPENANEYYNILKGMNKDGSPIVDNQGNETQIMYSGNPSEPNDWSLCSEDKVPETTAIITSRSNLLQPGAGNEILVALYAAFDFEDNECPNLAAINHKEEQVQKLYNTGFFHFIGPPPPTIEISKLTNTIMLSILDIPNGYSERIPEATGFQDDRYNFEGIQIYQVGSRNFDLSELNNPNLSRLIYQGDIENNISELNNWKTLFTDGSKSFVPIQKVDGENIGIASEVIFDFDFLKNEPIDINKPYYFVAISYAHNNYQQFLPSEDLGQKFTYLASTCGVKVLNSEVLLSSTELEAPKFYHLTNDAQTWTLDNYGDYIQVNLISTNGQMIKKWDVRPWSSIHSDEMGAIPSGVYFLQIINKKTGSSIVQKLVDLE